MIYVGVDIASTKHDCCIVDENGSVLSQFSFNNDISGFNTLLESLNSFSTPENTRIGLENTGVYGDNLKAFLRRNGFKFQSCNPLLIKKSIQATTLRKTKTDKADARFLARYMTQVPFKPDTPVSYHIRQLKSLSRRRMRAVKERSKIKTIAKGILMSIFPEYVTAFSDVFGVTAKAVLKAYPTPQKLANCKKATLTKLLQESSRGRFGEDKAGMLIMMARRTVGRADIAAELELKHCMQTIELLSEQIKEYDEYIKEFMDEIDSPILTIPGIGYTLGAMILSEIGDVRNFETPSKLTAFAGLDPSIYESGKQQATTGKMVKRGSPYLRWALINAAGIAAQTDPVFKAYMKKKQAEGKHYHVACSHAAKKLLRVIFAILKNNSSYSPFYSSFTA